MKLPAKVSLVGLAVAAAAIGGGILGWRIKPAPKLEPRVTLPDSAIIQSLPTPPKSLGQKLTHVAVKPAQVALTEGRPDTARVAAYCAPSLSSLARTWPALSTPGAVGHQTMGPEPFIATQPMKAILPPFAGKFHAKTLELFATRSDGSLYRGIWNVHQPVEWGSADDSIWVTQPRLWVRVGQGAKECVKRSPIGGLVGLAIGLAVKNPAVGALAGAAAGCADGFVETVP